MTSRDQPRGGPRIGVRIAGTGSALPSRVVTNRDLEKVMDTSDEWIVQRTGIRERRVHDRDAGESAEALGAKALAAALADARTEASEVDLVIAATMTASMPTPSTACVISSELGCGSAGAFDINAACSGFVFALNMAHEFIRGGQARCVGIVGVDTITRHLEFSDFGRSVSVLFGDAAGAVVLRADDDPARGMLAQAMHADGGRAHHLYIPIRHDDRLDPTDTDDRQLGLVRMNGQAVFKFAVSKFPEVIEETLNKVRMAPDEVDLYVCHQANTRILDAARQRFGLSADRLPVNMERYGNTVAASVPLLFDELRKAGRVPEGGRVMFLAFGAGLTWGSSLWKL
ncbi:MAG: beta-ketoacyl-ACP synthase III [Planctomycetota bacterium]|nr:beta-ketoacyl-ACP synthase III [Planctomycetota bacterium]